MSPSDRRAELLGVFYGEAKQQIQTLNDELMAIEAERSLAATALPRLLRTAHGLKGSAAVSGLSRVERIMHDWESCVGAVVRGTVQLTDVALDLLYRMIDAAEVEIEAACGGERPETPSATPSHAELAAAFGVDVGPKPSERDAPAREAGSPVARAVRVPTAKIDAMLVAVEDLVSLRTDGHTKGIAELTSLVDRVAHSRRQNGGARDRWEQAVTLAAELERRSREHDRRLETVTRRLSDAIHSLRMVPAQSIFGPFARAVRDLSTSLGRAASLVIEGGAAEVDRELGEALKEPVMHLLRNAVSHGIETPEERVASGKPEAGRVAIRVSVRPGGIEVDVSDDGRGIDTDRIREAAMAKGLLAPERASTLSDDETRALLFQPGLTTAREVDAVSGRGIGLDAVRATVERCGGSIGVTSAPSRGASFRLRLPLSLTSMQILLVKVGAELIGIPIAGITELVRIERNAIRRLSSGPAVEIGGRPVPLLGASDVLGIDAPANTHERLTAVILETVGERVALVVDAALGEEEVIIKGLGAFFPSVPNISGAAVLATGRIVPVLSVPDVARSVGRAGMGRSMEHRPALAREKRRILVVDDSVTTRTLEKSILEAVGYSVDSAVDGVDALAKLRAGKYDLVLSDVQMPRMDGIELVEQIRRDERLRDLRLVLVSSLASDDDRRRGLRAGAHAYIGKSEFRQELLLETLERLL